MCVGLRGRAALTASTLTARRRLRMLEGGLAVVVHRGVEQSAFAQVFAQGVGVADAPVRGPIEPDVGNPPSQARSRSVGARYRGRHCRQHGSLMRPGRLRLLHGDRVDAGEMTRTVARATAALSPDPTRPTHTLTFAPV